MGNDGAREINPVQWFDERDAVAATRDFRPRIEPITEQDQPAPDLPTRKKPAKD